jgi:hypothetical protein
VHEQRTRVRLRQAVIAARELEPVAEALRATLALGEPYRDPGVGLFGLENAVFALGDRFLEVVSPTQPQTAAGRYLLRHGGDCGYMVMFDLEDLPAARARAADAGIRTVWEIDLEDISGTHLHPGDIGGAIVSIDGSRPYGSWRWGGPDWTGRIGGGAAGTLAAVTIAVGDPAGVAARWGSVLGVAPQGDAEPALTLDGGAVRFVRAADGRAEGLVEIGVCGVPGLAGDAQIGGVRIRALAPV